MWERFMEDMQAAGFEANAVKTNADHIRSMTDEELGGFLDSIYGEGWTAGAAEEWDEFSYCDWLKQPYKE